MEGGYPLRKRSTSESRRGSEPEERRAFSFTSNADTSTIGSWDIKPQLLTDAILGGLQCGLGIMFGRSLDGGSVSVTIYDGDAKSRKWVSDVIDLEDVLTAIVEHAKSSGVEIPRAGLRAVGD